MGCLRLIYKLYIYTLSYPDHTIHITYSPLTLNPHVLFTTQCILAHCSCYPSMFFTAYPTEGQGEAWSLSLGTQGARWGTPWTGSPSHPSPSQCTITHRDQNELISLGSTGAPNFKSQEHQQKFRSTQRKLRSTTSTIYILR